MVAVAEQLGQLCQPSIVPPVTTAAIAEETQPATDHANCRPNQQTGSVLTGNWSMFSYLFDLERSSCRNGGTLAPSSDARPREAEGHG